MSAASTPRREYEGSPHRLLREKRKRASVKVRILNILKKEKRQSGNYKIKAETIQWHWQEMADPIPTLPEIPPEPTGVLIEGTLFSKSHINIFKEHL